MASMPNPQRGTAPHQDSEEDSETSISGEHSAQMLTVTLTDEVPSDVRKDVVRHLSDLYGKVTIEEKDEVWNVRNELDVTTVTEISAIRTLSSEPSAKTVAQTTSAYVTENTREVAIDWRVESIQHGMEVKQNVRNFEE